MELLSGIHFNTQERLPNTTILNSMELILSCCVCQDLAKSVFMAF